MTVDGKTIQSVIAYASIIFGVLTTQLQGIHLPTAASVILGVFGVLLHPDTSITSTPTTTTTTTPPVVTPPTV